ncbi:hypothetical protein [Pedobacter sp. L105]|uniref:hypothetical protein n=1 Tax=Pedobacter sp. L105 TaxID=1641871 RepID=UPI00131E3578|nr:hypothetical protein [Pedobacter sp. L105]
MEIVVTGADFSALGLGNTRWIEQYISAANITNTTYKGALRTLYNSMSAGGLDKKLEVLRLFFTGNSAVDSLNVLNYQAYNVAFLADTAAAHTASGYQPSSTQWGISTYLIKDLSNFHLHAWNSTPETSGAGYILGRHAPPTSTNSFSAVLLRGSGTAGQIAAPKGTINVNAGQGITLAGYDGSKTGLLSTSRNGTTMRLYDGGVPIATSTVPYTGFSDGTLPMLEGNSLDGNGSFYSRAKIFSLAYGASAWTDADELLLFNTLNTFKTTLGV